MPSTLQPFRAPGHDGRRTPTVDSPCVRVCCLDDADTCLGCGRTLQEIREWHRSSPDARAAILALARARLSKG